MRRHKLGMSLVDICRDIHGKDKHCDPRTAKAVIESWGPELPRLRFQALRSHLVDNIEVGITNAGKLGKLDSLMNTAYAMGIADPPKSQAPSVAVMIKLDGGPEPTLTPQAVVVEGIVSEQATETGLNTTGSDKSAYEHL